MPKYSELSPEQQARYDALKLQKESARQPQKESSGFSVMETIGNIPSSAMKFASDIAQPVLHPIDTATGLGNLGMGIYEKLTPGIQEHEQYADAAGQFYKDRYGSMDSILDTLQSDPVGLVSDLSLGLTGAGTAVKAAGMGGKLQKLGMAVDPVNALINAPKAAAKVATSKMSPVEMYKEAAKFPTTLDIKKGYGHRDKLAQQALDYGILPNMSGAEKISDLLHGFNTQIDDLIDAANDMGGAIPVEKLVEYTSKLRDDVTGFKWKAGKNEKSLDKIIDTYLGDMEKQNITHVGVKQLQDFKQDLYKQLNYDAKRGKLENMDSRTGKAFASGARSEIEKFIPEVAEINRKWGDLIDLQEPLYRAAGRIGNRDSVGIGVPIKATAGASLLNQIDPMLGILGGGVGAALGIFDTPAIKARSAMAVNALQNRGLADILTSGSLPWQAGRQAMYQTGRMPWEDD